MNKESGYQECPQSIAKPGRRKVQVFGLGDGVSHLWLWLDAVVRAGTTPPFAFYYARYMYAYQSERAA